MVQLNLGYAHHSFALFGYTDQEDYSDSTPIKRQQIKTLEDLSLQAWPLKRYLQLWTEKAFCSLNVRRISDVIWHKKIGPVFSWVF